MSQLGDFVDMFPIDSIQKVYNLFEHQLLRSDKDPDLAFFSIIVGAVENSLTNIKNSDKDLNISTSKFIKMKFPCIEWEDVRGLHHRFLTLMRSGVDSKLLNGEYATRDLVKRVADVVWNSLTRSYYKDRAHLQSIYTFLTGNKLDCFGVAFAVTAGCQLLGKKDVHLALSEDHAWVVFGEHGSETAEVTWHGKGNEDKRGRSVGDGVSARSWLYVAGKPVICSRVMELAALVSSINPTLTPTLDVHEVAQMQHRLLWLLYDSGHLDAYPMALGNLGDLHEYISINSSDFSLNDDIVDVNPNGSQRPDSAALYAQAIRSSRTLYDDRHVYPYTFQGGFYHRHKMYKEAFHAWACAGDVIRHYNYSRDDEEIYKEFSEIANELIPQLMKAESSGHSARSILKDPECFASLLRFYDGICKWEEGSQTPILHIGWAKPLVSTISKFDSEVRAQVNIVCNPDTDSKSEESKHTQDQDDKTGNGNANDKWNNNSDVSDNAELSVREQLTAAVNSRPRVTLYSYKMAALKPLLLAERLNTHALQLQLTAQSQLQRQAPAKRREREDAAAPAPRTPRTPRAKRARRDR